MATLTAWTLRHARRRGAIAGRCSALLAAALLVMAACGDDDDGNAATLDGRTFVSTEVAGETLVDGTELSATFDGDSVSTMAGCNTLFGGFEIDDGTLVVEQLAQNQVACDDANQAQDVWVSELLQSDPTIELSGDVLTLPSGSVTVTLGDEASDGG
jgi:heat shock protein HslJ